VIHPRFEKGMLAKLHPFFQKPSDCAITYDLAQRLSRSVIFRATVDAFKLEDLDSLCNQMVRLEQSFPGEGTSTLKTLSRFIVTNRYDYLTVLLSDQAEMGPKYDRQLDARLLFQGRVVQARVRDVSQHMRALREANDLRELMLIASDPEAVPDCAFYAIDELALAGTLQVQKFLLELSKGKDERLAVRALHSLAMRGEAHDLVERIAERGGRLADCLLDPGSEKNGWEEFDLYLVMRSFAAIGFPRGDKPALELFERLNTEGEWKLSPFQKKLIMSLKEDGFPYVKWLAAALLAERSRLIFPNK